MALHGILSRRHQLSHASNESGGRTLSRAEGRLWMNRRAEDRTITKRPVALTWDDVFAEGRDTLHPPRTASAGNTDAVAPTGDHGRPAEAPQKRKRARTTRRAKR